MSSNVLPLPNAYWRNYKKQALFDSDIEYQDAAFKSIVRCRITKNHVNIFQSHSLIQLGTQGKDILFFEDAKVWVQTEDGKIDCETYFGPDFKFLSGISLFSRKTLTVQNETRKDFLRVIQGGGKKNTIFPTYSIFKN